MTIVDPERVEAASRTRTHAWEDPTLVVAAAATGELSGLELLEKMSRGELPPPPIASTLGFDGFTVGPGWARFALTPGEHHYNPIGSVHGGVAATMLDSAMGCAVHTTLEAGVRYTTVDLSVTFVKALTADTGPIRCEGRVIHTGSRVATAEGRITDAHGRLYASGTTTCLVIRP
jgi:uncharacterized protein (TIGR00369 family)